MRDLGRIYATARERAILRTLAKSEHVYTIRFCPGWKQYMNSLSTDEKSEVSKKTIFG